MLWQAVVFGNHDDESGGTREYQMKQLQALPYNLVDPGPKDIHGVGNYVLKVKSADPYVPVCVDRRLLLTRSQIEDTFVDLVFLGLRCLF